MTRFRIPVLLAVLSAAAVLFAACGGSDDEGGSSSDDPQKVLENAGLEGVESGNLDMSLNVHAEGKDGGDVEVNLSGPFEAGAKGEFPQVEISAEASGSAGGEDIDFDGGLTLLTDRGFVEFEGTAYEVDPTTFGFLKSALEQAQQQEGSDSGDITACQKAAEGIKFSQFAEELANEGSVDVEGTQTTKISGDLNVSGFIDALIQLTEDPACSSQLEAAGPLPIDELEEAEDEVSKAVKDAHIELYVGDDDIVRKIAAELTIQPADAGNEKVEMDVEVSLSGVNEEQSFSAPSDAQPLEGLFQKLGVNPLELLEGTEDGLGGLLESLSGGFGGGSSSGGSSSGGSDLDSAGAKEYAECLRDGAETAAELQKCASLLR